MKMWYDKNWGKNPDVVPVAVLTNGASIWDEEFVKTLDPRVIACRPRQEAEIARDNFKAALASYGESKPEPKQLYPIEEIIDGFEITGYAYSGDFWKGEISDEYGNYVCPFAFTGDVPSLLMHLRAIIEDYRNDPHAGD